MAVAKKILVTGGVRSGKSRYALDLAGRYEGRKVFVATAQAFDEGMTKRIADHQKERGNEFETVEEPVDLARVIREYAMEGSVVLIDCLTLWVNNVLFFKDNEDDRMALYVDDFIGALEECCSDVIVVTNEVGLGVMPENRLARRYADWLGAVNQRVAKVADDVVMMVCGVPLVVCSAKDERQQIAIL